MWTIHIHLKYFCIFNDDISKKISIRVISQFFLLDFFSFLVFVGTPQFRGSTFAQTVASSFKVHLLLLLLFIILYINMKLSQLMYIFCLHKAKLWICVCICTAVHLFRTESILTRKSAVFTILYVIIYSISPLFVYFKLDCKRMHSIFTIIFDETLVVSI